MPAKIQPRVFKKIQKQPMRQGRLRNVMRAPSAYAASTTYLESFEGLQNIPGIDHLVLEPHIALLPT